MRYKSCSEEDEFDRIVAYIGSKLVSSYSGEPACHTDSEISGRFEDGLEERLSDTGEPFSAMLIRLLREKNLTGSECYRRAGIDRRLFSKILSASGYCPGKNTVLALSLGLRLSVEETRTFLARAGFSFSPCSKTDIVVEYYLSNHRYDIDSINSVLFRLSLPPLGSSVR